MRRRDLLNDEWKLRSKDAEELGTRIDNVLLPLIEEYSDKGYKLKDISYLVLTRVHYLLARNSLRVRKEELRRKDSRKEAKVRGRDEYTVFDR